ncbi:efflux RND transporter periplasmic adaptor subunit [Bacteroidales bacterium OttesenSCG-928-M06]|nr:efflux RND transporter periplasmic adaptor subunit [Bacteroidales bacterium OttesenSCG-928-M06]
MRKDYYILFLLIVFLPCISSCKKESIEGGEVKKTRTKQIIETGEIDAVYSKAFTVERYGRSWYEVRVIGILEHGSLIEEGDSIIQLDPTEINKSILDWESQLETQLANLEKLRVDQDIRRNDMRSNIKSEQASFELSKLSLDASRFESERLKKIKELEFEQAKIRLTKEKRKLELYDVISASDMKVQEIRVRQLKNQVENAYSILPKLTIRTPIAGVFQIAHNWRTNALVKLGDNIYPGNNMANVPELRRMKVNTYVNETDFLDIHLQQKVAVRLDALPNVVFDGEVNYIGKLCRRKDNKSRQKVFDVEVRILKPDERLKPGMTVSCEYL